MRSTFTFYQLIEHYCLINIPIIQRDYAQGRADQDVIIIRNDFISSLRCALCPSGMPLNLDFVYGTKINGAFQPLDGQQRLTTLFLLHWYLAWTDGCAEDFRAHLIDAEGRSRFSYEVRPSSREFIKALASYEPDTAASDCSDLAKMITDQPWYFRSWHFDPTIRSVLSVLDRIHEVFRQTSDLYARLSDDADPPVTFQLLDLEQFDLSDDLYIKMNARGKQLTPFETFKARLEKHLTTDKFAEFYPLICNGIPISEYFAQRIDTHWSDFFWSFRDERTATFDDAMMNFFRAIIMVTRAPDNADTAHDLSELRLSSNRNSFAWFHENSWLDQKMVLVLITLLHRWGSDPNLVFRPYLPDTKYINEIELFKQIISQPTSLTFENLAKLAGYVQYLVHAHGEVDPASFNDWVRIVFNLSANTDYNRPEDLQRSFTGLRHLTDKMNDIQQYLAEPGCDVSGFSRLQLAEERIKAHLLALGDGWPDRIYQAEQHPYFKGQIGFLLRFCGIDLDKPEKEFKRLNVETASVISASFEHYFKCADQMFSDIKNDSDQAGLWRRALLAAGDYLPRVGRNKSLCIYSINVIWSWKRLLRNAAEGLRENHVLKQLWDRLGQSSSLEDGLAEIIKADRNIDPWRRAIIDTPATYDYGTHKMLRFSHNDAIYLLRRSQMNGRHVELFTYCLYKNLITQDQFAMMLEYRESTSTEVEPGLSLSHSLGEQKITFYCCISDRSGDKYRLHLENPNEPDNGLRAILQGEGFRQHENSFSKLLNREDMKDAFLSLYRAFADYL
ncbi:MAG: DUF262 domain-containing protein [Aestuariivita sp.]|nr:DUF262 domain-containing protein [Aestuariivita sp.]